MTISIINENGKNPVLNAIFAEALLSGRTLIRKQPYTSFDVDQWSEFCSIAFRAYAACSRDNRGVGIFRRIPVRVTMPDGREFHTTVWCDVEQKCLRYVSLY